MEGSIFPKLSDLLQNFVEIRLHTDVVENAAKHKEYEVELARTEGIPIYVIIDPGKPHEPLDSFVGLDLTGGREFGEFLRRNSD